ncbi:uncharacterized protein N0V89_004537 [Didymosphaeria variabile]|uniref:Peptidase C14 caspase domain-containing protein n=1 Tax=Didymosphaeria variabile TaxID=1932322 RepID=A0A9W8XPM2_9PLEO|nr:uncharacterized protein N0V89_004537 [Didymosphaeria variabile]KAJ4356503.1 hypothetical protein N0V89_004537 [Didymosphaeria variabile]
MSAPRQPLSRAKMANCSSGGGSPVRKGISRQNSATLADSVAILRPDDEAIKEELKREAERQTLFQKVSNFKLDAPNGYRKVEVLIIRWDESIDEFKGHDKEIDRLQNIFTLGFGFGCRVARIKNDKNPQISLNFEILKHVNEHDGENNLLIVYYTGHGNQVNDGDGQHLELSALSLTLVSTQESEETSEYLPAAHWDKAEDPLKNLAAADALAILDCCFASTAAIKGRNEEFRTYQLLAASAQDNPTNGPGKLSFTNALCESLEELLKESKDETFPVIKLWERINTKRKTQAALIWDRLQRYKRNIELGRLAPESDREASFKGESPEQASLVLRLSLKTRDLENGKIEKLGRQLPVLCKEAGIPIRRMEWVKMEQRNPGQVLRHAVKQTLRRNPSRRKSSPGQLQQLPKSPESRKRTQSDLTSRSAAKRRAHNTAPLVEESLNPGLRTPARSSVRSKSAESESAAE